MAGTSHSEAQAKLKLNLGELREGKAHIEDFAKHGHQWFQHVGSAGRAFHKVMHEITQQSPIMGTVLQVALNPIVGTLTAATIAFGYFERKLEDWNKQMEETEKLNAKKIGFSREQLEELRLSHDKAMSGLRTWVNELTRAHDEAAKALERELKLNTEVADSEKRRLDMRKTLGMAQLQLGGMTGAIMPAEIEKRMTALQREHELEQRKIERRKIDKDIASTQSAKFGVDAGLSTLGPISVASAMATEKIGDNLKKHQETLKDLREQDEKSMEKLEAAKKRTQGPTGVSDYLTRPFSEALQGRNAAQAAAKDREEADKALKAHRQFTDAIKKEEETVRSLNKEHLDATEKTKGLQEQVSELSGESHKFQDQLESLRQTQRNLSNTPITPQQTPGFSSPLSMGIDQLAKYNTPYGRVAQEINLAYGYAQQASASGRFSLARNLMKYIYGGKFETQNVAGEMGDIRNQFAGFTPEKGLMNLLPPGLTTEQTQKKQLDDFIAALKGPDQKGLPVIIADVK